MHDDSKKYEEQNQRNMASMLEMQDTINQLQRELSVLGKQSRRSPSEMGMSTAPQQVGDGDFFFVQAKMFNFDF